MYYTRLLSPFDEALSHHSHGVSRENNTSWFRALFDKSRELSLRVVKGINESSPARLVEGTTRCRFSMFDVRLEFSSERKTQPQVMKLRPCRPSRSTAPFCPVFASVRSARACLQNLHCMSFHVLRHLDLVCIT